MPKDFLSRLLLAYLAEMLKCRLLESCHIVPVQQTGKFRLWVQSVDETHWLKRLAGVS